MGSLSQHVKFIGVGAFLKSLDEAESQFEDLLGFFKMEGLQGGASFEGVAKERGGERKGELPLFLHPS